MLCTSEGYYLRASKNIYLLRFEIFIARINHLTHSSKLDELKQTKKRYKLNVILIVVFMFVKEVFTQDFLQTTVCVFTFFMNLLSEFFKDLLFNLNRIYRLFDKII